MLKLTLSLMPRADLVPSARALESDWITRREAIEILGVSRGALDRLIRKEHLTQADRPTRRLSRKEVEALATERREWISARQAAEILGVHKSRVGQLADAGLLPFERGSDGRRLYRRRQVEVIANARRVRWHPDRHHSS